MELLFEFFAIFATFVFFSAKLEKKFRLIQKLYFGMIFKLSFLQAIFVLRGIWLLITYLLANIVNVIPIYISAEMWNQLFVAYTLAILGTTLVIAFLADYKYWKVPLINLSKKEIFNQIQTIKTVCSFCTTALFGFLLAIQSTTANILKEYSADTGLTDAWVLIMFVAWLAASFASIKVVTEHFEKELKNTEQLNNEIDNKSNKKANK